jgi:hypothetical protein
MIVEKGKAEVAMFSFFEVGKKSKTLCGVGMTICVRWYPVCCSSVRM